MNYEWFLMDYEWHTMSFEWIRMDLRMKLNLSKQLATEVASFIVVTKK